MRLLSACFAVSMTAAAVLFPLSAVATECYFCHEEICRGFFETLLEGEVVGAGTEGSIIVRIDRIHGLDDGTMHVGDTIETYATIGGELNEVLVYVYFGGSFSRAIPIEAGEVFCPYKPELRLAVSQAVDAALDMDGCWEAVEAVWGETTCPEPSMFDCTSGRGSPHLLPFILAFSLFAAARRRSRLGPNG